MLMNPSGPSSHRCAHATAQEPPAGGMTVARPVTESTRQQGRRAGRAGRTAQIGGFSVRGSAGGGDRCGDAATHLLGEANHDGHVDGIRKVPGDQRGQVLGEDFPAVEGAEVELQGSGLDAFGGRQVLDVDRVEIRLAGDRTDGRQLLRTEVDQVKGALHPERVDLIAGGRIGSTEHRVGRGWSPGWSPGYGTWGVAQLLRPRLGLRPWLAFLRRAEAFCLLVRFDMP